MSAIVLKNAEFDDLGTTSAESKKTKKQDFYSNKSQYLTSAQKRCTPFYVAPNTFDFAASYLSN